MSKPENIVAVTLGSNGFHLFSMIPKGNMLEPGEHLYRNTSIQSYIDDAGNISDAGLDVLLKAVSEFRDFLDSNPPIIVGAIATGTFRFAVNGAAVLEEASRVLGTPVRVLSGEDEGLLCYMGIASSEGFSADNRLVVDIGGASTEIMVARKNKIVEFHSLELGCVSLMKHFFHGKNPMTSEFEQAHKRLESEACWEILIIWILLQIDQIGSLVRGATSIAFPSQLPSSTLRETRFTRLFIGISRKASGTA